jgi:hypothetical protein
MISMMLLASLLLLLCLMTPTANANKQVVFFAGPHQAGASSVEKFYHNYASGYNNAQTAKGLDGWVWPRVQGNLGQDHDLERPKVFNFLVTHAQDEGVQQTLTESITQAYSKATEGIIIGSEEFDRIGDTRETQRDGLLAMETIANTLHVEQEDVWVILNYRTPRADQWISFWKHSSEDDQYRNFLCNQDDVLWEIMNTAMNPLGLAQTIREQTGWNVVLIDLVGVEDAGADVSHVIACEILGNTNCRDGFVYDRYNKTFHLNHADKELSSLSDGQVEQLEILFRQRDCAYKEKLSNDHAFFTLHESTLWQGCSPDSDDTYQQLTNTTTILNLVQSQKGCSLSNEYNISDYLVGDIAALTAKKDVETLKKDNAANQFEDLAHVEKDKDREKEGVHPVKGGGGEKSGGSFGFGWLLVLALLGAALYRLYATKFQQNMSHHLWDTGRKHKHQAYRPREYDLDAEYGFTDAAFRDEAPDDDPDEDASQEELEMSLTTPSYPDWREDDNDLTQAEVRRNQNKMMMQMPKRKSALTAPSPGNNKNYEDGFDLAWAQGHEIESSEEEGSDSEFEDEH